VHFSSGLVYNFTVYNKTTYEYRLQWWSSCDLYALTRLLLCTPDKSGITTNVTVWCPASQFSIISAFHFLCWHGYAPGLVVDLAAKVLIHIFRVIAKYNCAFVVNKQFFLLLFSHILHMDSIIKITSMHIHTDWRLDLDLMQISKDRSTLNKLDPYRTGGRLLLTANFKVKRHKN